MMSGHTPKPIFFNIKKLKIGLPENSLNPNPPTSDNISFFPNTPPTLKVDFICVSLLKG